MSVTALPPEKKNAKPGTGLGKRWSHFGGLLGDPFVWTWIIAAGALGWFGTGALMTVIYGVASTILGVVGARRWSEIQQAGPLVGKGRSAVRALQHLRVQVERLQGRLREFLADVDKEDKLLGNRYEEMIGACDTLKDGAANSIEEWVDIVPEAAKLGEIGREREEASQLHAQLEILAVRLDALDAVTKHTALTQAEREVILTQLRTTTELLTASQSRVRSLETEVSGSGIASLSPAPWLEVGSTTMKQGPYRRAIEQAIKNLDAAGREHEPPTILGSPVEKEEPEDEE